jgi:hypothetical protein
VFAPGPGRAAAGCSAWGAPPPPPPPSHQSVCPKQAPAPCPLHGLCARQLLHPGLLHQAALWQQVPACRDCAAARVSPDSSACRLSQTLAACAGTWLAPAAPAFQQPIPGSSAHHSLGAPQGLAGSGAGPGSAVDRAAAAGGAHRSDTCGMDDPQGPFLMDPEAAAAMTEALTGAGQAAMPQHHVTGAAQRGTLTGVKAGAARPFQLQLRPQGARTSSAAAARTSCIWSAWRLSAQLLPAQQHQQQRQKCCNAARCCSG